MVDKANAEATVNATISIVHAVGSTAQAALFVGQPALAGIQLLVQIASLVGLTAVSAIPVVGPILAILIPVLTRALPILVKVAAASPQVQAFLVNNKAPIETVIEQMPDVRKWLQELYALAANADPLHVGITPAEVTTEMIAGFLKVTEASYFTPQDPRFDRASQAIR